MEILNALVLVILVLGLITVSAYIGPDERGPWDGGI